MAQHDTSESGVLAREQWSQSLERHAQESADPAEKLVMCLSVKVSGRVLKKLQSPFLLKAVRHFFLFCLGPAVLHALCSLSS